MFFSLSKTIARFGGFRLGLGIRISKKNMLWMSLLLFFVLMVKLMWYMMIVAFWLMYAMFYSIYWCIKKTVQAFKKQPLKTQSHANYTTQQNFSTPSQSITDTPSASNPPPNLKTLNLPKASPV